MGSCSRSSPSHASRATTAPGTRWRRPWPIALGGFVGAALVLGACCPPRFWLEAPRALPCLTFAVAVGWGTGLFGAAAPRGPVLALVIFALALLAKIFFNVHAYHYGFVLALPATLLVVVALLAWVPAAITAAGGCGALFRAVAAAAVGIAVLTHVEV